MESKEIGSEELVAAAARFNAFVLGDTPRELTFQELPDLAAFEGSLWIHFDMTDPRYQRWLENESGLPEAAREALLADETRPRLSQTKGSDLLVNLRGVNTNPGEDAEDMVALRAYCTPNLLVTARKRRLQAAHDCAGELRNGLSASTAPDLLARLAGHLLDRVQTTLDELDEELDDLEEREYQKDDSMSPGAKLAAARRCVIALKRHLSPQRDVLSKLALKKIEWFGADAQLDFVQAADHATRYVEELEELRERSRILQDEYSNQLNMEMNKRMFMFSVVAAIFLPLSLFTGLLGINVGGIPGANNELSFWAVCGILVGVGILQVWFLRKIRWI